MIFGRIFETYYLNYYFYDKCKKNVRVICKTAYNRFHVLNYLKKYR